MTEQIFIADPEILGGTPVFNGTRVPVAVLFENLADGLSLRQILDAYPTIPRDLAVRALQFGQRALIESVKTRPSDAVEPAHVRYLVNPRRRAKSHIWTGDDTLCKMWSTGGLKTDSYEVAEMPGLNGICSMCSTADRT